MDLQLDLQFFITISMALFLIGIIGVLKSRNPLILFLSIEMMLNSANLLGKSNWTDLGFLCSCRCSCRSGSWISDDH